MQTPLTYLDSTNNNKHAQVNLIMAYAANTDGIKKLAG